MWRSTRASTSGWEWQENECFMSLTYFIRFWSASRFDWSWIEDDAGGDGIPTSLPSFNGDTSQLWMQINHQCN